MLCPNCKTEIPDTPEEARFCPTCGKPISPELPDTPVSAEDLPGGAPAVALPPKHVWGPSSQIAEEKPAESDPAQELPPKSSDSPLPLPAESLTVLDDSNAEKQLSQEIEANFKPVSIWQATASDCTLLKVEYKQTVFFLSGSQSTLMLQVTPLSAELKALRIFLESQWNNDTDLREIKLVEKLKNGSPVELRIPFTPASGRGEILFRFYVECTSPNGVSPYTFQARHKVYDAQMNGQKVDISIQQQIKADYVGENTMGLNRLLQGESTVNELIRQINDLPDTLRTMSLKETIWHPEDPTDGAADPRIVMEWNGYRLHLLKNATLRLGRSSSMDIVLHGDYRIPKNMEPNTTISRHHANLVYDGDTVRLQDKSTNGIAVNDVLLGNLPQKEMTLPQSAILHFAGFQWRMEMQCCTGRVYGDSFCRRCPAHNVKAMFLSRIDDAREFHLLVWQCFDLGKLFPALKGWTIYATSKGFSLLGSDKHPRPITPGKRLSAGTNHFLFTTL